MTFFNNATPPGKVGWVLLALGTLNVVGILAVLWYCIAVNANPSVTQGNAMFVMGLQASLSYLGAFICSLATQDY